MTWKDLLCLVLVIIGVVSFLYGANYYDAAVGWVGIGLVAGGLVAYVLLRSYKPTVMKKKSVQ